MHAASFQQYDRSGDCRVSKKTEIEKLTEEISRLMAALEDMNFECQRLEIVNANLDFQLKEANRELRQNIALLQTLEEENEALKTEIRNKTNGI